MDELIDRSSEASRCCKSAEQELSTDLHSADINFLSDSEDFTVQLEHTGAHSPELQVVLQVLHIDSFLVLNTGYYVNLSLSFYFYS